VPEDDAIEGDSKSLRQEEGTLEGLMRERIRSMIETLIDEKLEAALGAARSQRVGSICAGFQHGKRECALPSLGARLHMPDRKSDKKAADQWQSNGSRDAGFDLDFEDLIASAVAQVVTKSGKVAKMRRSKFIR
jgi:hypothetical protein